MHNKVKVISAFPGIGKTYATSQNKKYVDSDSSKYSWLYDGFGNKTPIRNSAFPDNYIKHIKNCINDENIDYVFVSSHADVKKALSDKNIPFISVYPMKDIKNQYLERIRKRSTGLNDNNFIDLLNTNWDKWIPTIDLNTNSSIDNYLYPSCKSTIYLDINIFLTDMLSKIDPIYDDQDSTIITMTNQDEYLIKNISIPYNIVSDVKAHQNKVYKHMINAAFYITKAAIIHDKSKLSDDEKSIYSEVIPKLKGLKYGSEEYRNETKKLGPALRHHYSVNRHHPEHFNNGVADMNLMDLIEMTADWIAASERNMTGNINESVDINVDINQIRFGISDQLMSIIKNTINELKNGDNIIPIE